MWKRHLMNLLTVVSLLLSVTAAGLWLYSGPMERLDSVSRGWGWHNLSATSSGGRLAVWFGSETVRQPEFPWEWQHERDVVRLDPAYPPGWSVLGFGFRTRRAARREPPFGINSSTLVIVPYWQVFVVAAVLPAWRAAAWARRRRRSKPGHCRSCGYDLRATPGRCPECGTVPAAGGLPGCDGSRGAGERDRH